MTTIKALFLTLIFGLFIGCSSTPPPPSVPEAPKTFSHTVKYSGETFGALADWYLGDSKFWNEIQKVNPAIKPNKIKIGDVIQIPSALAKKTAPYPKPKKKLVAAPKPEEKSNVPAAQDKSSDGTASTPVEATATGGDATQQPVEVTTPVAPDSSTSEEPSQGGMSQTSEDQQREALREKTRQELLQEVLAGEATPVAPQ